MSENTNETLTISITIPKTLKGEFSWSPTKDSAKRTGNMVMDLSKLTSDDVESYLWDTLIIKHQGKLRRQFGTEKWEEPKKVEGVEQHSMIAEKPGQRKSADPVKQAQKEASQQLIAAGLTPEQIAALIAQVKGTTNREA